MALRIIKGIWMNDDGTQGFGHRLHLEITEDGQMFDPAIGPSMPVRCEVWGGDAPIFTNGAWTFWPDEDELTRLGITPTQMIAGGIAS
jgi:hypothetical protein